MEPSQVNVFEPYARHRVGFLSAWIMMFRNIRDSRELIFQLFKRDFFATYKKSFLGVLWVLIAPIVGVLSWVFMNATGVLQPGDVGIPYPAYVLLSSSIWGLFVGFYSSAAKTLDAGNGFILQVRYAHEVLLVKQTAQHLANFLVTFLLNIAVLFVFGVMPDWRILFFPLLILPLFFLGAGLGLMVALFGAVSTEVQRGMDVLMGLLTWVTPVIYSAEGQAPALRSIIGWNPLTYLVGGVRDVIIYGRMEHWDRYGASAVAAFLFFLLAWRFFFLTEDRIIERMV
jgi:lipopolysaccharide transport system permease protein